MRGGAHPLHPALVHFPLGLLLSASMVDLGGVIGLWSEPRLAAQAMAAGLVAGLLAMGAGLVDLARLDEALMPQAMRHMAAMLLAWLGYAVAFYLRRSILAGGVGPSGASLAASLGSAALLVVGGWLGGELVYRYGAGRIGR